MADIITRKEAKALGLIRYYTGKPCKRGHVAERYVSVSKCVACNTERESTPGYKAYKKANSERKKAYDKAYREANSDRCKAYREANSDRYKAASRAWRESNLERKKAANREWQRANPDRAKAATRAWNEANQDKGRSYSRNRRARKKSAEGSHTAQDIQNIYETQKGLCAYCKIDVGTNYHVDHIQPLSKGGSNSKENLQITCPTCNMRKNAKTHEEFLAELKLDTM